MKSLIMRTTTLLFGLFLSLSINAQITIDFNSGTGLAPNTDYGSGVTITVGRIGNTYKSLKVWLYFAGSSGNFLPHRNFYCIRQSTINYFSTANDGSEFDIKVFGRYN